jgi:unsaturated rhamnogalacturonyl hydrolase
MKRLPLVRSRRLSMAFAWLAASFAVSTSFLHAAAPADASSRSVQKFGDATPLAWSERMANSEMARLGDALNYAPGKKARWDYTSGLFAYALERLGAETGSAATADYGANLVESFIAPDGTIRTYAQEDYNLDMITPGRAVLLRYEQTKEPRLKQAVETLRGQLARQPRTSEGGFWHKLRYPHQMWLDGLYMAGPFYAHYGKVFGEPTAFDDVAKQILLIDEHLYDAKTGLFYHGWDESRTQGWANPQTGASPNFWSRAIGWYGMAIVDVLDDLPPTQRDVEKINAILRRFADGVVRWQDPASGVWWEIADQGARTGNYLESTASSMFVYTLAKAINRGYLPRDRYLPAVLRGYAGLVEQFIETDAEGRVNLTQCCSVGGLGYTNSAGRARDGSFEYYVSEPVVKNDLKGVGPFILAGIEVQKLLSAPAASVGARGWGDLDAILARIHDPVFPDRNFPITDYGAKPGADATAALRAAIAACHAAGGGHVIVPAGEWQTGAIHLLSNVDLHVSRGATLLFSTDPAAYLPAVFTRWEGVECMNYSPLIYAFEQENIAVTGEGTLDGQADWTNWWGWNNKKDKPARQKAARDRLIAQGEGGVPVAQRVFGDGSFLRPNFIQPYRCKNVLIEGVKIVRSPMWEIHPVLSTNVTVRRVSIFSHGPNNDGCDPESSRDVLIEECVFDTGDDCIAIKSGRNNDGRRVDVPSENIVVRNSTMKDGHGGVVLGSECSGSIRNVFVENCTMDSPNLDRALRFKSNAQRGGHLENVFMRNVRVGQVAEAVLTIDLLYEEGAKGDFPPVVRNIQLDDIVSQHSPRVLYIRGFDGAVIDDIRIAHSTFNNVTETEVVQHAGAITFHHVSINPAKSKRSLNSPPPPSL